MFRRSSPLLMLLAALAISVGSAAASTEPSSPPAPAGERPSAQSEERPVKDREPGQGLRELLAKFRRHCAGQAGSERAHTRRCKQALLRLLHRLEQMDERVEKAQRQLAAAIEKHCGSSASGSETTSGRGRPIGERCALAKRKLARLGQLEARIERLIEQIKKVLADVDGGPADVSGDDDVPSVEEVAKLLEQAEASGQG